MSNTSEKQLTGENNQFWLMVTEVRSIMVGKALQRA